jgi:hypothetical protein
VELKDEVSSIPEHYDVAFLDDFFGFHPIEYSESCSDFIPVVLVHSFHGVSFYLLGDIDGLVRRYSLDTNVILIAFKRAFDVWEGKVILGWFIV